MLGNRRSILSRCVPLLLAADLMTAGCTALPVGTLGPAQPPVGLGAGPFPLDAATHLDLVAEVKREHIEVVALRRGTGPARAYLGDEGELVVLLKSLDGRVLHRISLADPLLLRVLDAAPRHSGTALQAISTPARVNPEQIVPQERARLRLFLPDIAGVAWLEFHAGGDSGPMLGRAIYPEGLLTPVNR